MRFRVDAALLRKHLDFVKPGRSKSIPILQAISIVACETDGKVFLSHHDAGRFLRTSFTAIQHSLEPTISGLVVVDWFDLQERLKGHRGIVILEESLTRNEDDSLQERKRLDMVVEATGARTRLPVYAPEDLPCALSLHCGRETYFLKAPAAELLDVMSRALPVAAEDSRFQTRGVHIRSSKTSGAVRVAATDAV